MWTWCFSPTWRFLLVDGITGWGSCVRKCVSVLSLDLDCNLHLESLGTSLKLSVSHFILSFPHLVSLSPSLCVSVLLLHQEVHCFLQYIRKDIFWLQEQFVQASEFVEVFTSQAWRGCVTADRFSPVTHGRLFLAETLSLFCGPDRCTFAVFQFLKLSPAFELYRCLLYRWAYRA